MKKLSIFFILTLIIVGCSNDSETTEPISKVKRSVIENEPPYIPVEILKMIKQDLIDHKSFEKAEQLASEYSFQTGKRIQPNTVLLEPEIDPNAYAWIRYEAHVQTIGWQGPRMWTTSDGQNNFTAGTTGQSLRMEAARLNCVVSGLKYRAHVETSGWQSYVKDWEIAGTTGQSLRMEAIEIIPPGDYHVYYCAHVQNIGWQNWVHGWSEYRGYVVGSTYAGTVGQSLRMEALQCKIYKYTY